MVLSVVAYISSSSMGPWCLGRKLLSSSLSDKTQHIQDPDLWKEGRKETRYDYYLGRNHLITKTKKLFTKIFNKDETQSAFWLTLD